MYLSPGNYTFVFTFVNGTKKDTKSSLVGVQVDFGTCGREHMYERFRLPPKVRMAVRDGMSNPHTRMVRVAAVPSWSAAPEPQHLTNVYREDIVNE